MGADVGLWIRVGDVAESVCDLEGALSAYLRAGKLACPILPLNIPQSRAHLLPSTSSSSSSSSSTSSSSTSTSSNHPSSSNPPPPPPPPPPLDQSSTATDMEIEVPTTTSRKSQRRKSS